MGRGDDLIKQYKRERAAREAQARQAAFAASYRAEETRTARKRPSGAAALSFEQRRTKAALLKGTTERRERPISDFELREAPNGVLRFGGYASVTESPYEVAFYVETIKRGAFKRTLGENPDVQLLINHGDGGSGMPIARTGRNMTLTEDERGLRVDAELDADDPDVELLARKMNRGLIDGMSFAFRATDDEWNDARTERVIRCVSIHKGDVSVVNMGANPAASATIRSRPSANAAVVSLLQLRARRESQDAAIAKYNRTAKR